MRKEPLHLELDPKQGKKRNDRRAVIEVMQGAAWCNRDVVVKFDSCDPRNAFVSRRQHRPTTLTAWLWEAHVLCPKSWPCILWMCDTMCREADIPFTPMTARRLVGGAMHLILSTEDHGPVENEMVRCALGHSAGMPERLGQAMLKYLVRAHEKRVAESTESHWSCDGASGWEAQIGLDRMGLMISDLPRITRAMQRECAMQATGQRKGVVQLILPAPRHRENASGSEQLTLASRLGSLYVPNAESRASKLRRMLSSITDCSTTFASRQGSQGSLCSATSWECSDLGDSQFSLAPTSNGTPPAAGQRLSQALRCASLIDNVH